MPLDYEIAERELTNGLRVIVSEDHSVPTVTVNLWVGVGSRHELAGKTGFAHLFEHLMFQGSRQVESGEHFAALMAHGGRVNATTWFDRTNYFETVPTGAFELALWLEADRHGHLLDAVTQENLDNQRDVVKEEKRQRYDNVPYGQAMNTLYSLVFPADHPYHHPTIGSMADLDAATLEDVHAFFRRYYTPQNTVLTLVGDLTPWEGFSAAERYFGGIRVDEGTSTAGLQLAEPLSPLTAPVRLDLDDDVPADRLYLGFRLPPDDTPEFIAATTALDILGGLFTSRLEKRLVRGEEICNSASASALGLIDGVSMATLAMEATDGVSLAQVEETVCEELDRLRTHGPTVAEMEASLAQTERSWLSSLASMDERADHISHCASLFDDPRRINTFLDRVAAITADQAVEAAATWLRPEQRAVVAYAGGARA